MNIPFAKARIGEEEIKAVEKVMRSGWLTRGKVCQEFEEKFAEYVGAKYAISLNSCTSALFLALKYYTDVNCVSVFNVAVPAFTFTASASIIKHCKKDIKFVDVRKDNYCIDENKIQDNLNSHVISVHLTGNKSVTKLDRKFIIEDSAHRIERNTQGDNPVCYSFYATKNMTTGEGGMLTTNDENVYSFIKKAMLHGTNKDGFARYANKASWEYTIDFTGWKMNMTDLMAAIGIEQLKKLDAMNARRKEIIDLYNKNLNYNNTGLHLFPIFVNERAKFMDYMLENGIHCSCHFLALHKMPAYKEYNGLVLPNTERLSSTEVSLPLYPDLTDEEVNYISEKVLQSGLLIKKEEV